MNGTATDLLAGTPIRLRRYVWALAGCWTIAIAVVLTWRLFDASNQAIETARSEAAGAWRKEAAIIDWAAASGLVYVPVYGQDAARSPFVLPSRNAMFPPSREEADGDQPADDRGPNSRDGRGPIRFPRPYQRSEAGPAGERAQSVGEAGARGVCPRRFRSERRRDHSRDARICG